jgi:hypothetical protein
MDVVEEGIDVAVRVRLPPLEDSELTVRALGKSRALASRLRPKAHQPRR